MGAVGGSPVPPAPSGAEQARDQGAGAFVKVESTVPGRTRLRLKPEHRTPEAIAEVTQRLDSHEDVGDVTVNPRTGSVVVVHATHRKGEEIASEALRDAEAFAAAMLDLPDDADGAGGDRFGKLDQQLADLVYRIDYAVWQKTRLHFRGQLLAGGIAGLGVAQIAVFGISLEMLPGPLLLWIAWDIYHRVSQEPPFPDDATAAPADTPAPGGALVPATP
jgi:Heavy metal associated domain 2